VKGTDHTIGALRSFLHSDRHDQTIGPMTDRTFHQTYLTPIDGTTLEVGA